jgi:hypothetical protein
MPAFCPRSTLVAEVPSCIEFAEVPTNKLLLFSPILVVVCLVTTPFSAVVVLPFPRLTLFAL